MKKFDVFLARPWKLSYDELTLTCELCVKNWHAVPHSFSFLTLATWRNSWLAEVLEETLSTVFQCLLSNKSGLDDDDESLRDEHEKSQYAESSIGYKLDANLMGRMPF